MLKQIIERSCRWRGRVIILKMQRYSRSPKRNNHIHCFNLSFKSELTIPTLHAGTVC